MTKKLTIKGKICQNSIVSIVGIMLLGIAQKIKNLTLM